MTRLSGEKESPMPDTEKSNPPNAPALPTGDGQAKGSGYGADWGSRASST